MNGKISDKGLLFIERGGRMKGQECRKNGDWCADNCSLFGEPKPDYDVDVYTGEVKPTGKVTLHLCHKTLTFDTLIDERGALCK